MSGTREGGVQPEFCHSLVSKGLYTFQQVYDGKQWILPGMKSCLETGIRALLWTCSSWQKNNALMC
jgi:hypothetical protein